MDKLIVLEACDDGTCCCLSPRSSVFFIAIISLSATIVDVFCGEGGTDCCGVRQHVDLLRNTLLTLFQKANILLLLGSLVESALLVQIYLWYALGFIVLGFVVSIMDFLFRFQENGAWSFISFVTEVAFLFGVDGIVHRELKSKYMQVTSRCLPLVDLYRKRLERT